MIDIMPFNGIRYNESLVGDINSVVTPPYDRIDDKLQGILYDKSPYNFVRLDKGRELDKYASASRCLDEWLSSGVFIKDAKPSIYLYNQEYTFNGVKKVRRGYIALLRLDEFKNGNVLPHEHTLKGPKADRLSLIEATEATFGQIFMLFSDLNNEVFGTLSHFEKENKSFSVYDGDKNLHTVWPLDDSNAIASIQAKMKNKKLYIADGHHRYETSLKYQDIKRQNSNSYDKDDLSNFVMCTFVNMDDYEGMSILPTHRFIHDLESFNESKFLEDIAKDFTILPFNDIKPLETALASSTSAFGLILDKGRKHYLICLKEKSSSGPCFPKSYSKALMGLDVAILHKAILENALGIDANKLATQSNVDYYRDKDKAISLIKEGKYQVGFLLNPTKMEDIKKVTESGEKMPQKSTDFYPKLLSGLVVFSIKKGNKHTTKDVNQGKEGLLSTIAIYNRCCFSSLLSQLFLKQREYLFIQSLTANSPKSRPAFSDSIHLYFSISPIWLLRNFPSSLSILQTPNNF